MQAADRGAAVHSGTTSGREEGGIEGREDWVGVGTVWGQAGGVRGNGYHSREVRTSEGERREGGKEGRREGGKAEEM